MIKTTPQTLTEPSVEILSQQLLNLGSNIQAICAASAALGARLSTIDGSALNEVTSEVTTLSEAIRETTKSACAFLVIAGQFELAMHRRQIKEASLIFEDQPYSSMN